MPKSLTVPPQQVVTQHVVDVLIDDAAAAPNSLYSSEKIDTDLAAVNSSIATNSAAVAAASNSAASAAAGLSAHESESGIHVPLDDNVTDSGHIWSASQIVSHVNQATATIESGGTGIKMHGGASGEQIFETGSTQEDADSAFAAMLASLESNAVVDLPPGKTFRVEDVTLDASIVNITINGNESTIENLTNDNGHLLRFYGPGTIVRKIRYRNTASAGNGTLGKGLVFGTSATDSRFDVECLGTNGFAIHVACPAVCERFFSRNQKQGFWLDQLASITIFELDIDQWEGPNAISFGSDVPGCQFVIMNARIVHRDLGNTDASTCINVSHLQGSTERASLILFDNVTLERPNPVLDAGLFQAGMLKVSQAERFICNNLRILHGQPTGGVAGGGYVRSVILAPENSGTFDLSATDLFDIVEFNDCEFNGSMVGLGQGGHLPRVGAWIWRDTVFDASGMRENEQFGVGDIVPKQVRISNCNFKNPASSSTNFAWFRTPDVSGLVDDIVWRVNGSFKSPTGSRVFNLANDPKMKFDDCEWFGNDVQIIANPTVTLINIDIDDSPINFGGATGQKWVATDEHSELLEHKIDPLVFEWYPGLMSSGSNATQLPNSDLTGSQIIKIGRGALTHNTQDPAGERYFFDTSDADETNHLWSAVRFTSSVPSVVTQLPATGIVANVEYRLVPPANNAGEAYVYRSGAWEYSHQYMVFSRTDSPLNTLPATEVPQNGYEYIRAGVTGYPRFVWSASLGIGVQVENTAVGGSGGDPVSGNLTAAGTAVVSSGTKHNDTLTLTNTSIGAGQTLIRYTIILTSPGQLNGSRAIGIQATPGTPAASVTLQDSRSLLTVGDLGGTIDALTITANLTNRLYGQAVEVNVYVEDATDSANVDITPATDLALKQYLFDYQADDLDPVFNYTEAEADHLPTAQYSGTGNLFRQTSPMPSGESVDGTLTTYLLSTATKEIDFTNDFFDFDISLLDSTFEEVVLNGCTELVGSIGTFTGRAMRRLEMRNCSLLTGSIDGLDVSGNLRMTNNGNVTGSIENLVTEPAVIDFSNCPNIEGNISALSSITEWIEMSGTNVSGDLSSLTGFVGGVAARVELSQTNVGGSVVIFNGKVMKELALDSTSGTITGDLLDVVGVREKLRIANTDIAGDLASLATLFETTSSTSMIDITNCANITACTEGPKRIAKAFLRDCGLTALAFDQLLVDLDAGGMQNGTLVYGTATHTIGNGLGSTATVAEANLVAKGWTITPQS